MAKDENGYEGLDPETAKLKATAEIQKLEAEVRREEADIERVRAEVEKTKAEADKTRAEAREGEAKARKEESLAEQAVMVTNQVKINTEKIQRSYREELAADKYHRIYRFTDAVSGQSAKACMAQLALWMREETDLDKDQKSPIEIAFSSPGGSVIDGMALWDFIQEVRAAGHFVTTSTIGYAASMAGILLQAGDKRSMGREAYVLIHEISFDAGGKIGEVEDEVEFIKKIQDRVLSIFADRAAKTNAKDRLTKRQIAQRWKRKDWWLSSDECLDHGFVDEVRG